MGKAEANGLDKEEQEMFIDTATVFEGKPLHFAKAAWSMTTSGFEEMRWQHLVDLSLAWVVPKVDFWGSTYTAIGMHEQLKSLGRNLARIADEHGRRIGEWATETLPSALRELRDINNIEVSVLEQVCSDEGFKCP